jgi:hypothetical protein
MNANVQAPRHLVVDLTAEAGQAAERRLDMSARAAEAVIEVEVAEGGIEVVHPHQAHHAPAEPDAFGIAGRARDDLGGFGEFSGLALVFLGRGCVLGGLASLALVLGVVVAALGKGASGTKQENDRGDCERPQEPVRKWKHASTHKFPD